MGTGSPFLVDRKGKPKDNISVSVNTVQFGLQGGLILHGDSIAEHLFSSGKKWSVGHLSIQTTIPGVDRSNPQLLRFVA